MGWSIDLIRPRLEEVFTNLDSSKRWDIQHVNASNPEVMVRYEGDIPNSVQQTIVNMLPEFVYVNFLPNQTFPLGESIAETH